MSASQNLTSLNCELRITRAKNVEFVRVGYLFVRYYLLTGTDKRILLASQELSTTCNPSQNEAITLECEGAKDIMDKLRQQSVVFELRWRKTTPVCGIFGRSRLLFSAEVGWKDVLDSTELSIQKWVTSSTASKYVPEGLKSPALQVEMKIQESRMLRMSRRCPVTKWNECGCKHGECHGGDDDIFALAALEVL